MVDQFAYILIPLIVANVIHMYIVKKDLLPSLTISISKTLFGKNKTWRGVLVLIVLNAILTLQINFFLLHLPWLRALCIGLLLGFAYMLFELPNSYLKRRMGIPSGGTAINRGWLFQLLDKADSSFGVAVFSYFLLRLTLTDCILLFFTAVIIHILFSQILVYIRLKKTF